MKADPRSDRWLIASFVSFAVSVAAMGCFEANDGDLGFHLATGREILRSGRIPSTNVLSFSEPEQPWLLHQWLPALLFEWGWQRGGLALLTAIKLPLLAATWLCVLQAARALALEPARACAARSPAAGAGASLDTTAVCLIAASASAFRFELRPYLFTHLTLAIAVLALARASSARPSSLGRCLVWSSAALCAGTQLHAGAIDGALLLGLFALGVALEPLRARLFRVQARSPRGGRAAFSVLAAVLLGFGGGALLLEAYHPWGARILAVPFDMATHRYWGEHLVEFRSPWKLPFAALAAYWVWLATVVICLAVTVRRVHAGTWLCTAVFAFASLVYVRMAYAFAIVSAPLVAAGVRELVRAWRGTSDAEARTRGPWLGRAGFVLLCLAAPVYVFRDHTPGIGLSSWTWPSGHFAYIREQALRGRSFVSDAWAGPFLGAFYPERTSFYDNRLEAYSDHFARNVYQHIRYGHSDWHALLSRYQVEFLVLRYTTPREAQFQGGAPNLRQHLARDPRYSLVHFDDVGALFVRRDGPNAALAREHAIPGVDPDRRAFVLRPALVAPGLLRAAERGNHSLVLIGLTALALADAGDRPHAQRLAAVLRERAPEDPFTRRVGRVVSR